MLAGHTRLVSFGLVGLSMVGVTVGAQSTRSQEIDVLNALLLEVRGLRAVMEQTAAGGPRVQLALGRLQIQEQRVHTAVRRLDSHRSALAAAEKESAATQAQLAAMEKMFQAGVPLEDGNPLKQMISGLQQASVSGAARLQDLQAEDVRLEQEVAQEQARWLEVNGALEELERALTRR